MLGWMSEGCGTVLREKRTERVGIPGERKDLRVKFREKGFSLVKMRGIGGRCRKGEKQSHRKRTRYTAQLVFPSKPRGPIHRPPNVPTHYHYEKEYNLQEKPTPAPTRLTTARAVSLAFVPSWSVCFLLLALGILLGGVFVRCGYGDYIVVVAQLTCFRAESEIANPG